MSTAQSARQSQASFSSYNPNQQNLTVDMTKVTISGVLAKRGNIFNRYKKQVFYLEDYNLKYGKQGKDISTSIDLREAILLKDKKFRTQFKIKTPKTKLRLKAETEEERDRWMEAINRITGKNNNEDFLKVASIKQQNRSMKDKGVPKSLKNQKSVTLSQISEILQKQDSKLNLTLENSQKSYQTFSKKLMKLEQQLDNKKHKEKLSKILEAAQAYQDQQKKAFEMMTYTNRNLYKIVETIAEKEIERNPIEFIRRESFQVEANEQFFSLDDSAEIDVVHEEDEEEDEENEYHEEENAIDKRLSKYTLGGNEESKQQNSNRKESGIMEDNIVEELEEVFHECNDNFIPSDSVLIRNGEESKLYSKKSTPAQTPHKGQQLNNMEEVKVAGDEEENDPPERSVLPFFKDPKIKISIWTIIKDSIGKDISKISVPVYFNDPTNILQKCAASMEYCDLLDVAIQQQDSIRRLAFVSAYVITNLNCLERNSTKPFNPLLGETFEVVTKNFRFLAEQVSHHPPVTAFECQGFSGWKLYSCNRARTKFTGKSLNLSQMYKYYIEFPGLSERYEIELPTVSAHNLILGSPYLDIGGKSTIKNLAKPGEWCQLEFHKRGWSANTYYRVDGDVFQNKKDSVYRIEGKWSEGAAIINQRTGEREQVWTKNPYPEQWEYMYGFSHFMMQLNYLPNFLKKQIPPTDTRYRPDQRALENGDMKLAAYEKNRLEEKQRAVRKYNEKHNIEHKQTYFEPWSNPDDDSIIYYKYNGTYWEKDWKNKDWSRLPDLYSEKLPPEVEEFLKSNK